MKRLQIVCLLLLLMISAAACASAAEMTSTDLIENAAALDKQTVVYIGEVIGDILPRGDHAWVNVSDGANAIGIWIDEAMLREISVVGRYGQTGDTVRVTGIFNRTCQEHGGDMDIHAERIDLIKSGQAAAGTVSGWMVILASVFTVFDVAILIIYLKRRSNRSMR